ncbi:MAG: hypothetical protein H7Z11_17740 [Verrucomicrobia bacterium]|nr:hypothetical protein [Leptolyngbya sp. ES-bin-22]
MARICHPTDDESTVPDRVRTYDMNFLPVDDRLDKFIGYSRLSAAVTFGTRI